MQKASPGDKLRAFLGAHELPKGADPDLITHQSFGADNRTFRIHDDDATFLRLYAAAVESGERLSLCERPLAEGMPLVIDLDIECPLPPGETSMDFRLWAPRDEQDLLSHLFSLCNVLHIEYSKVLALPPEEQLCFTVLARDKGYAKDGAWKDGLHIQCSGLFAPSVAQDDARPAPARAKNQLCGGRLGLNPI